MTAAHRAGEMDEINDVFFDWFHMLKIKCLKYHTQFFAVEKLSI